MLIGVLLAASCTKDNEEAPSELKSDHGPLPVFGCSAVRNGNFYGRNLDFNINEICEFVVRTKATETRKHASIGVANTCFLNITNKWWRRDSATNCSSIFRG